MFSFEEENAIRYVGGYVVVALKKRETDIEILAGLDHLTEKCRSNQQREFCYLDTRGQ